MPLSWAHLVPVLCSGKEPSWRFNTENVKMTLKKMISILIVFYEKIVWKSEQIRCQQAMQTDFESMLFFFWPLLGYCQVSVLFPQGALRLSWPMFPWLEVTSGDAEIDRDGELKFSLESRQRLKEQKSKHAVKFANNSSVLFAVIWKPPGQLLLFTDGTICTHTSKSKGGRIKMNYAGNLSYESDKKENPLM